MDDPLSDKAITTPAQQRSATREARRAANRAAHAAARLSEPRLVPVPRNDAATRRIPTSVNTNTHPDNNICSTATISSDIATTPNIDKANDKSPDPEPVPGLLSHALPIVEAFRAARANVLADLQIDVVDAIRQQDLSRAPCKDLALMLSTLHNLERLERGQSTSNVDIIAASIDRISRRAIHPDKVVDV